MVERHHGTGAGAALLHRINRAADDAAGLAIAQNLCVQAFSRSQIPSEAGTAMLSQAAKGPQYVLALLS